MTSLLSGLLVTLLSGGGPVIQAPQVWLFSDLGMNRQVWRIPAGNGLEDALANAGWQVNHRDLPQPYKPDEAPVEAVLAMTTKYHHGKYSNPANNPKRAAIGFGLGGIQAAHVAAELHFDRLVLIGTPLAWGGSSRAADVLFAQEADTDWSQVAKLGLQGPTTRRSLAQLLLTHGLPSRIHTPFRELALAPIHAVTLRALQAKGKERPVPVPNAAFHAIKEAPNLEVLVITSMADGLFPAWQCDPAAFGLRRENITRVYFTRANDNAHEYNHLDLLLHPSALGEVHPLILEWLARP